MKNRKSKFNHEYDNLIGMRFGNLLVIKKIEVPRKNINKSKRVLYECKCDCGTILNIKANILFRGRKRSCGCLRRTISQTQNSKEYLTAEYSAYKSMIYRCYNKKANNFSHYGGRGISVCREWLDKKTGYETFLKNLGRRPNEKFSLERNDNDGDYCPENCRWATKEEQFINKRGSSGSITLSKRFHLYRKVDISGISGCGIVADGVWFPNNICVLVWRSIYFSVETFVSINDLITVHGHNGNTLLVWDDPKPLNIKV